MLYIVWFLFSDHDSPSRRDQVRGVLVLQIGIVAARYKLRVILLLTVSSLFVVCGFGITVGSGVCSRSSGSSFC